MEFFLVIEQGLDLMLTGMMTVFTFLGLLILLINLSSLIFRDLPDIKSNQDENPESSNISHNHMRIINQINKRV
ncbi:OadG family transporter subunit [Gammaproteobacteria bacterium]|nr:OadG family transporter subunit [Gammaproteobacteria bacterium]